MAKKKAASDPEIYIAKADAKAATKAKAVAPFTITIVFLGGLTTPQKNAFKSAADRWSKVIVGDLPNVVIVHRNSRQNSAADHSD